VGAAAALVAVVRRIGERCGPASLLSDGTLRSHPDTPATRRHLRLARLVIADIES